MSLEFVLGLKAGIGGNFAEAEAAMRKASVYKEKVVLSDPPEDVAQRVAQRYKTRNYAINIYGGPGLGDSCEEENKNRKNLETEVREALTHLKALIKEYGKESLAVTIYQKRLQRDSFDPATGALVPFGYMLEQELNPRNPPQKEIEKFIVLVDCNDMHYWNENTTYDLVTEHINAVGRALVQGTRSGDDKRSRDLVYRKPTDCPIYVNRTHGSAGDEFIVDLYCRKEDVTKVVQRLFDLAYQEQMKLYAVNSQKH